jgi:signal transduction histidine kinase
MSNRIKRSDIVKRFFTSIVSWPLSRISVKRKKAEEDLKSAYGQLEKKVKERTKDLLHANWELEREIIERKNAEEVKESLIRHKDMFINQLGHDLKTPLTVLVTLLPLIEKQEKNPKTQKLLHVCSKNVTYMKDLIIKTIKLARADSASRGMNLEHIPLLAEVTSYIGKMDFIINEKKIKLENRIHPDVTVTADKTELEELFYNLISNAVKYTPENGTVIIETGNGEPDMVTVSIKDTGIGLSQKHITHIFDEFYKVDESRHELDSSGLGLSICRKIVDNHGGRIWAESPGEKLGSTFHFTLQA